MNNVPQKDLADDIELFCNARGISVSAFGERAVGDRGFYASLRRGRDCRKVTVKRVRDYMDRERRKEKA